MNIKIISETKNIISVSFEGEHYEYKIEKKNKYAMLISVLTFSHDVQYGIITLGNVPKLLIDPYNLEYFNDDVKRIYIDYFNYMSQIDGGDYGELSSYLPREVRNA